MTGGLGTTQPPLQFLLAVQGKIGKNTKTKILFSQNLPPPIKLGIRRLVK